MAMAAAPSTLSSSLSKPPSLLFSHHSHPFTKSLISFPKTFKTNPLLIIFSKNPISDITSATYDDEKPREECGVVGIYGDSEASRLCYLALHALQHRGQEGAGIVSVENNVFHTITGVGLVSEVFNHSKLDHLPGSHAIGHVRYSTAGQSMLKNVQPFVAGYRFGSVGVAHNGNLVNCHTLKTRLEDNGSIFNTTSDTEVVLHLIATSKHKPFILRVIDACEKLKGAYSFVFVTEDDSIVRGTTSSKIVRLIKEAGAKEVHMRIASPPIIASCYYGVDTPSSQDLISNRMCVEQIRDFIGCDSLAFLPFHTLKTSLGNESPHYCYACFSGNYPVDPTGLN